MTLASLFSFFFFFVFIKTLPSLFLCTPPRLIGDAHRLRKASRTELEALLATLPLEH